MSELTDPDTAQDSLPPSLLQTLSVATAVQITATSCVLGLTAIAPEVARDLGVGSYWIGYQISLIYTAGMISSALAGALIHRLGPVRVELSALACFLFGFLGIAAGSVWFIIAASLLIGVGYGLNNPAASELLSRVTPRSKRNLVYSIKQAGVPLGGIFASFAFPFLAGFYSWQASLLSGALISLAVMTWLVATHRPESHMGKGPLSLLRNFLSEQSVIWRHRRLRTLCWLGFAYSAMQLSVSTFAVVTLVQDAGWSLLAAGSVAAAMQFSGAFGRIFWGGVADRLGGGFRALALLGLLSGLGFVALANLQHLPTAAQAAAFALTGLVAIGWNGVLLAEVAHSAPSGSVGALTGGVLVYTFIGVIVGPSTFATLYAVTGHYSSSFLAFSCFGFLGMVLSWHTQSRSPG